MNSGKEMNLNLANNFHNKTYIMDGTYFIPCYMTMLAKSVRNLDVTGTVDVDFTLLIRISKHNLPADS